MKRVTLHDLPKALEPYRSMIEWIDDGRDFSVSAEERVHGDPLVIALKPGYHDTEADTHAVVEHTVKKAAWTFKHFVKRVTDCEECNADLQDFESANREG